MATPPFPLPVEQALVPLFAANTSIYWRDLPLLIVIISLVYSATRFDDWGQILREAARWGLRLGAFLLVIVAVLYVLASFISS
jgi:hypothetical protein